LTLHARYGKLQTPAWPVFMCLAPSVNDSLSTSRYGEQLTLNQWVLGSSPRWCTIPSKSERTSFRRCVRICFLSEVSKYEI